MAVSATEYLASVAGPQVSDERIELDRAALGIALIEYPQLRADTYLAILDDLSSRAAGLLHGTGDPRAHIAALNRVLFQEFGLRGNDQEYYDARNSFLNDVLERKLGIPITLSVVYIEVARRIGFPLFGVGMPGHFLVKHYDVGGRQTLVDPYQQGAVVTPEQCQQRLEEIYSGQISMQPEFLVTVTRRQILLRMLNNLKSIFATARNFRKMLPVLDLVLTLYPHSGEELKQRAVTRFNLGMGSAAVQDFETYLATTPEASDADEIKEVVTAIRRQIAMMN